MFKLINFSEGYWWSLTAASDTFVVSRNTITLVFFQYKIFNCSLKQYHQFRTCFFLFKLFKFKTPDYLCDILTLATSQRSFNYITPISKSAIYHDSILVDGIQLFNSLPNFIENRDVSTVFIFFSSFFSYPF